ncbi:hypothetical protein [Halorussus halophilus]|uniref:hypothetical protein n=1 Tax=Halorussus halophilus TaxID=2650975 RepID=UPI0013015ED4|nr:hypothetical protein [Halorussus halophilus]
MLSLSPPLLGGVDSVAALLFTVLGGLIQLAMLYYFLRLAGRIPAAFEDGYRNVVGDEAGDDGVSFWRYVVPIVGVELLVVAALWPSAVDSLLPAVGVAVYLFFGTLIVGGFAAGSYLVVRRFEDGFRTTSGESNDADSTPRRYVWWLVGLAASLTAATFYGFETQFGFDSRTFAVVFGVVVFLITLVVVGLVSALGVLAVRRFIEGYRTSGN